mgnify:CR=1 FL=1|jgi:hypothetical protein
MFVLVVYTFVVVPIEFKFQNSKFKKICVIPFVVHYKKLKWECFDKKNQNSKCVINFLTAFALSPTQSLFMALIATLSVHPSR